MGHTHTLLTPTVIVKEALRLFKNNLVMGSLVYRDYEAEFPGTPKVGGSVQIRKPVKFRVTKSRVRVTSTITETYLTLTVATQAHVSWQFIAVDLTLTIEQYSERYIRPACAALANQVDADLCALYKDVWNEVFESTAAYVTPNTFLVLGKAMQRLDEEAVPPDGRVIVFDPAAHWSMANALSNWNYKEGGEQALRKGFLGRIANAEIYMDQNIKTHTMGNMGTDTSEQLAASMQVASSAVSAAGGLPTGIGQGVTANQSILIQGFPHESKAALVIGDVFTIATCYAVNPMSGESTGQLRQFVVTADLTATATTAGGAIGKVYFQPDMIQTGPYKTVDTIPALASKVLVLGNSKRSYPVNLAFQKNAFALVMVPLEKPDSAAWSATASEEGFSIRIVKDYNIDEDRETCRLDILYGVKTIYPDHAVRIMGAQV